MIEYKWLDNVFEDIKDVEAPDSFKLWSLLFTVSAASKRRVLLSLRGKIIIYPNLYIMLIADSGFGKQFSIDLAENLLKAIKRVRIISGRNSIEAIIEELGRATTLRSGGVIKGAEAAIMSGEFANLLLDNPNALTILTELYDSRDEWKNSLRKGRDILANVFCPMLTATNMEHFNDKIAEKDLKGGFIARTMLVKESKVSHLDSLLGEGPEMDYEKHSLRLAQISELSGKFRLEKGAIDLYNSWYYDFYSKPITDKTGFIRRIRAHILKVSMCLSLVERNDLMITERHMSDSMNLCLSLIDTSVSVAKQTGKSKYRSQNALIIQQLIKAPNYLVSRRSLMNANIGEFTHKELNEILETLIQGDYIQAIETDGEPVYRLTNRCIVELERIEKDDERKRVQ